MNIRSEDGLQSMSITFYNAAKEDAAVYWLNYEGKEIFYFLLQPEETRACATYVSHPWRIRDTSNRLLQECIATEDAQTCIIPTSLRSTASATSIRFTVNNTSGDTIFLYWLDFQGNEAFYQELATEQTYTQQTYIYHAWRVKDRLENTLLECILLKDTQTLLIQNVPQG